jgi:hypothetical protein
MATHNTNLKDVTQGQITATPNGVLRKLGIRKLIVRGVTSKGRKR